MSNKNIEIGLKKGRVLVTGGNGFIGGHTVDNLIERGYQVTVLDRFGAPHRNDVEFVQGDVRDRKTVFDLASKVDGIINLAAILGTSETVDHPQGTVSSNLQGALNIFEAAKQYKVRVTHITVGNYWMHNPYAITKNAAEKMALFFNQAYGTKISVVRGLNAYGERQKAAPVRKIMPNLVLPALRTEEIIIYGDGEQKMDMIYIKDLARILVDALVMEHGAWDRIFEAGSGDAPTVNQICDIVMRLTKSKTKITKTAMRKGEPNRAVVRGNPETLMPLGILPKDLVDLEVGTQRTIDYYQANLNKF